MARSKIALIGAGNIGGTLAHLAAADPVWAAVLPEIGPLPLRRREDGFAAILGAVVSQQLSTHAADAIARKLQAAGLTDPTAIAAAGDEREAREQAEQLAEAVGRPASSTAGE